jgi:hypothetical protein
MSGFEAHQSDPDAVRSTTPADVAFDLLSSRQRRYILYYLTRSTGPVELRELAAQLVRWDETTTDDHEQIITLLYHVHLPKLEESDVLTFDSNQRLIELKETADELKPYLDLAAADDFQTQAFDPESKRGTE